MNDCRCCGVVVNGSISRWKLKMSGNPQESILGPLFFNMFIKNLETGIEWTLSRLADNTKMSVTVDTTVGRDIFCRGLDKTEKRVYVNKMTFNKAKCKELLCLGWGNPRHEYRTPWEWDSGGKLNQSQECYACNPEVCFKRGVASRVKEVVVPFCSTLMKPNLEYCRQVWGPQQMKDVELLKHIQWRAMMMTRRLELLSYQIE